VCRGMLGVCTMLGVCAVACWVCAPWHAGCVRRGMLGVCASLKGDSRIQRTKCYFKIVCINAAADARKLSEQVIMENKNYVHYICLHDVQQYIYIYIYEYEYYSYL
jgi:hypothetical protein